MTGRLIGVTEARDIGKCTTNESESKVGKCYPSANKIVLTDRQNNITTVMPILEYWDTVRFRTVGPIKVIFINK